MAAGTGAQIVGRIAVRVLPDLTGFREELNAQLRSNKPQVRVDVVPELGRFLAQINAAVRAAEMNEVNIRVRADEHWIDRLGKQLNGIKGVDLSGFNRLEKALLAGSINAARLRGNVEQVGRVLRGRPEVEMADGLQRAARFARANYLFLNKTGQAMKRLAASGGRDAFVVSRGVGDDTDLIRQIKGFEKLNRAVGRFGGDVGKAFRTLDDQVLGFRRSMDRVGESPLFNKTVNGFSKGIDAIDAGVSRIRKAWSKIPDTPFEFGKSFDNGIDKVLRRLQGSITGASDRTRILNDRTEQFTRVLGNANDTTDQFTRLIRRGGDDTEQFTVKINRAAEAMESRWKRVGEALKRAQDRLNMERPSKDLVRYNGQLSKVTTGWNRVGKAIEGARSGVLARFSKDIARHQAEVGRIPRFWRQARKQIKNEFSDGLTDIILEPLDEFGRVWGQKARDFGDSTRIIRQGVKELTDSTAVLRDSTRILRGGPGDSTQWIREATQPLRRLSGETEQFTSAMRRAETTSEKFARQLGNLKSAVDRLAPGLGDRIVNYGKSVRVADEHTGRLNRTTRTSANVVGSLGKHFTSVARVANTVLRGALGGVTKSFGLLGKAAGLAAKPITAPIAAFRNLGHTAKIVVALLAVMPGLLGLVMGLIAGLPSLLFAAGAGFAAVALGLDGIKAAAKTVQPEFDAMKRAISQEWQDGLTPILQQLKPLFPVVTEGLREVTSGMLDWGAAWADTLMEADELGMIEHILGGIGKFFSDITPFMDDSLRGILNWTKAGVTNFGLLSDVLNKFGEDWLVMTQRTATNGTFDNAMQGLATSFGTFFNEWIMWLEYGVGAMGRLGYSISNFISGFSQSMFGLMPILEGIFVIISGALSGIGNVLDAVFTPLAEPILRFAQIVESNLLQLGFIVANTLGPIAELIAPIFNGVLAVIEPIVASIFSAFMQMSAAVGPALSGITASIGPMVQQVVDSITPIVTNLANTIGPVLTIIGNAIGQIFNALAPSIAALGPILGHLMGSIANFVTNLLVTLAPVLQRIGEAFVRITEAVAPIIPAIGGFLSKAFDILAAAVLAAVDAIIPVVDALLPVLENVANTLVGVFTSVGNSDLSILDTVASAVVSFIQFGAAIATHLIPALNIIAPALQAAAAALAFFSPVIAAVIVAILGFKVAVIAVNAIMTIWRIGVTIFNGVMVAIRIGILAWTAAQWLLNVALNANPISLIVLAIAALVAGIIWVATQTTFFQDVWEIVWGAIKATFDAVVEWIKGSLEWFANLGQMFDQWVSDAYNAIVTWFTNAVNWLKALPGRILGAIGDLKNLLVNAGRSIIEGLWNGLKQLWENVKGWISGIGDWIARHKGPLSYDRKLLIPAGKAIMSGLQNGLRAGFEGVMSDVLSMGSHIESSLSVQPTVEFSGADSFRADASWRQELAHSVMDSDFGNEPIEITSVIQLDGKTVTRTVNKTNRRNERR